MDVRHALGRAAPRLARGLELEHLVEGRLRPSIREESTASWVVSGLSSTAGFGTAARMPS
jgi:hypothetical protein